MEIMEEKVGLYGDNGTGKGSFYFGILPPHVLDISKLNQQA